MASPHPPANRESSSGKPLGPLLAVGLGIVFVGSLFFLLSRLLHQPHEPPTFSEIERPIAREVDEPTPAIEAVSQSPTVDPAREDVPDGSSPHASMVRAMEAQAKLRGEDFGTELLVGTYVDADSGAPVHFFRMYLLDSTVPDPIEAAKRLPPSGRHTQPGKGGRIHFPWIAPGTYNLVVTSTSHPDLLVENLVIPHPGELRLKGRKETWIDGTVRDFQGAPLHNLKVFLDPVEIDPGHRPPVQRVTSTDGLGRFTFDKLPPGRYAMKLDNPRRPLAEHTEFYLAQGQHLDRSFQVPELPALEVIAVYDSQIPVARAKVQLVSEDQVLRKYQHADPEGVARLTHLQPGTYTMRVTSVRCQPYEETLIVRPGAHLIQRDVTLSFVQDDAQPTR